MNDIQENKLSMYQAAKIVFGNNTAVFDQIVEFNGYVSLFNENINNIIGIGQEQELIRTGTAAGKKELHDDLIQATIKVKNGIRAYAIFNKDKKMQNSVSYTDSELKTCRDNILAERAGIIHSIASGIATQLETLKITAEDIAAVNTLRKAYTDTIAAPRVETVTSKGMTQKLKVLFRETDTLLRENIDESILIFKPGNPEFVQNYFDARIIVDLGRRKTGTNKAVISGTITHFETEQPIDKALVRLLENGLTFTTGADGKFSFTLDKAGSYTIQVEKDGFRTYKEDTISIETGNELILDIELEPVETL